jgi:hypothetical protein
MKIIFLNIIVCLIVVIAQGQSVIDQKGTRISIDSSKWKFSGNNIYNKNTGNLGIGISAPTAQLHTSGDVRFQGIGTNSNNVKILTADDFGNITTRLLSNMLSGSTITSINGLTNASQTFVTANSGSDFTISSLGSVHTFNLPNASANSRGLLSSSDWNIFNGKENSLTFSSGLIRTGNTINVNTTQNINTLSNLTTDGLIKTSGGTGTLSIASATDATSMLNTFTSSEKGLVPASGGGTSTFLRADGTFSIPVGFSNRNIISISSDVINRNAVANTLADVTGLSFSVTAGVLYHFYAIIPYTSASPSNGSRWTIDAPASILLNYVSRNTLTPTAETVNYASAVNIPAASNNTSSVSGNLAIIEGLIKSSVNGILQIKFASETASIAITAKAGASLEYW